MAKPTEIFDFNSKWNACFLFGAYRSEKHQLEWVLKHKYYNVRAAGDLYTKRDGAQSSFISPDYIFLYDCRDYSSGVRLFKFNGKCVHKTEKEMLRMGYHEPHGDYFLYGIGQEITNIPPIYLTGIKNDITGINSVNSVLFFMLADKEDNIHILNTIIPVKYSGNTI